jgi:transcriptional regulator with XRE-family HTH domain
MTALRQARHAAGLSLTAAARGAGVTPGYLAALERAGGPALTWPRACRLAAMYRVDMAALLGAAGPQDRGKGADVGRTAN